MAKKHKRQQAASEATESVNTASVETDASQGSSVEPEDLAQERTPNMATLVLKNVQKNGIATYSREGVNASVYFNKSMFQGPPPRSITIEADGLTEPGQGPTRGTTDPAKLAQKAEEADKRAAKAEERAKKALERANKLRQRVAGVTAGQQEAETVNA
jgi:hypothetical protein